jgi:glycosyltransferase involved in cell wall biosynthesis
MKIAVFHNFLDNIGGAEIVTLILARELNADIYTTNIDQDKIRRMGFSAERIYSIGKIPRNAPFRQQAALWKFRKLNLSGQYDFFIIAGDWAMSSAVNNRPNLWFVHSPIREIWDLYKFTRNNMQWNLRPIFDLWVILNRHLNKKYLRHVDTVVCNSYNTQQRLKKYLHRDAEILYPPTETIKYSSGDDRNYWLAVNRLISHKRVDLQINTFRQLPNERLIIVGSYEQARHFQAYVRYIQSIKPDNVEIRSWITFHELAELYAHCKGFITTASDEDFGMTPVEAMASGKPVIAPNEGGYRETILHGKTGLLINDINEKKLTDAIHQINNALQENPLAYKDACLKRAADFDTKIFINKILKKIL